MERIGEYLTVELLPRPANRKTDTWVVYPNNGGELGRVRWSGRWRQYVFDPAAETTFNRGCLLDIVGFLQGANMKHRVSKAAARNEQRG